uniref:Uncharacterized protein n=1 Tax=Peronospora matthiolae TaxID=2874970 RepID=A0AAV1VL01_9STRA
MAGSNDLNPTRPTGHVRASPARGGQPVRASTVVRDSPAHEKSSATDDKILAALTALTSRMAKMESSQCERDESDKFLSAVENGMFTSALGANMCARQMMTDALMDSPEQKPAARPSLSRVPKHTESVFASLAPPKWADAAT